MVRVIYGVVFIFAFFRHVKCECFDLEVHVTQKIDNEGFHRDFGWLIEGTAPSKEEWVQSGCKLALRAEMTPGMFVNPDQVAELNRTNELWSHIDGTVDVEAPAHESEPHTINIYLKDEEFARTSIDLPVHLRYQRGQITGGFGKVPFNKPAILAWCPKSLDEICGKGLKVEAPCDFRAHKDCVWKNVSYQALFEDVELFVPVGDLDDYPLVSIVTLLLGCAGCIYILSVLSTTPL